MNYRKIGKPSEEVSILGFGMMRLPVIEGDNSRIDRAKVSEMVDYALSAGVNYFDTAYPYHQGRSEIELAAALGKRRSDVFIADKLPCWLVRESSDFDRLLREQLQRLQTDYLDFYLLHALNAKYWKSMYRLGVLPWLEEKKADGMIRHIGFSFHDELPVFIKIISSYDWEFCQIQYNYMDRQFQAGRSGLRYATARGVDVMVMEPLKGGFLAREAPASAKQSVPDFPGKKSNADMSLRWVFQQPEVKLVLSGMSTLEQVQENIEIASRSDLSLTRKETSYLAGMRKAYKERIQIACSDCKYCLPCPQNVAIPWIFTLYNEAKIYDDEDWGKRWYQSVKEENRGDKCVECGICEQKCPQKLPIISTLRKADKYLKGE